MKQIRKNNEPNSLTLHRQQANADYPNYPEKDELRACLCVEQRGICCYCMGAISPNAQAMKIEHFKSQTTFPQNQIDYWNLLGACNGNQGQPIDECHCDTYKGNSPMTFYPPSKMSSIETIIQYQNDGKIVSNNTVLDHEINVILNLNVLKLIKARKGTLDGFKDSLSRYKGTLKKATIEKMIADWKGDNHAGPLRPYCMVVVYWLSKKLK